MSATATVKVERPALRWFGGKWRLAPWIIAHLPPHDAYVEPYGGAASVLLRKLPAKLETWNDLHGRLVNFFTVLRERPDELVRLLELTPYARQEYEQARQPHPDPLEDARRFYARCWLGRVGSGSGDHRPSGWRYEVRDNRSGGPVTGEFTEAIGQLHTIAGRLRHVQIEHDDALAVISRYDDPATLFYLDPTYVQSTREQSRGYAHDLTDTEHRALANALHAVRGMVVLSGYPSPLYDDLYRGWPQARHAAIADSGRLGVEVLWFNPAAAAALARHRPSQGVLAW